MPSIRLALIKRGPGSHTITTVGEPTLERLEALYGALREYIVEFNKQTKALDADKVEGKSAGH